MRSKKATKHSAPQEAPAILAEKLLSEIRTYFSQRNIDGQRRFGITPSTIQYGVSMAILRKLARAHRSNHELSIALWTIEPAVHEARLLATLVGDPAGVTSAANECVGARFRLLGHLRYLLHSPFPKNTLRVRKGPSLDRPQRRS